MATKVSGTFGARLVDLRERRKASQRQLAAELKVSKATIAKWEAGTTSPSLDHAKLVADFFGVEVSAFVAEEEPGKSAGGLQDAQELLDRLTPALAAMRSVVRAAAKKGA